MEITSAALAKGGGAAICMGLPGIGIYQVTLHFAGNISKYDKALIEFLNDDPDNDVIFEVKKGETGDRDLETNDIAFFGSEKGPILVRVRFTADTSNLDKTFKVKPDTDKEKKLENIKKLINNGT